MVPHGPNLVSAMSRPQNCCVCHIKTFVAICSPQAGLKHTDCPFSVDDDVALASDFLLERRVSAMSSLQVVKGVYVRGWIKPHKWKCPILGQFHEGYVIPVCQFRYGQGQRQCE